MKVVSCYLCDKSEIEQLKKVEDCETDVGRRNPNPLKCTRVTFEAPMEPLPVPITAWWPELSASDWV